MPKRCHSCKASDHLIADCPNALLKETINKFPKFPRKKSERPKIRSNKSKQEEAGSADETQTEVSNQNGDEIDGIIEKDERKIEYKTTT